MTPLPLGLRGILTLLGFPLGALALTGLLLGLSFVRPTWALVGLVAALHTFALARVTAAVSHAADDPERPKGLASSLEAWSGFVAILGGLWGLLTPPLSNGALPGPWWLLIGVGGLAAYVGGRYAAGTDELPEGEALQRWTRLTLWAVGLVAVEAVLEMAGWAQPWAVNTVARIMHLLVVGMGVEILVNSWQLNPPTAPLRGIDPLVLRWFFRRWNPLASVGDAVQMNLGVDLRTTWAIQFLRAAVEPMAVGVAVLGWLCTGLVQVGPEEVAIHERLGQPVSVQPLGPGLHVVAPWPLDRLRRVPVRRVITMMIGAEHGEEEEEEEEGEEHHEGPENTLWARMHADEEYTLLLGNGRDLVTLDGLLHYRVSDPYTYLYGAQNPEEGLRAAAYEALTRRTVGRSLDAVLSENLSVFADEVVADIRKRATELDLGLEPVSFTLKGLHPPFAVALDYQAVVSAQIKQKTSVIRAQAERLQRVPKAKANAQLAVDEARAAEATRLAEAIGEAEAFRALVDRYRAAPALFRYRRRMQTLQANLAFRELTILDRRFEAQGGELWMLR
ncbi:MAG: protease modulator HflK [Myxococcota bacterium]